jgi:hypothetical protein
MTQAISDVMDCFRTDAKLDPEVRRASRQVLAMGDELIAAMELERKLDRLNQLEEWKTQKRIVDRLAGEYVDAVTACREAAERSKETGGQFWSGTFTA